MALNTTDRLRDGLAASVGLVENELVGNEQEVSADSKHPGGEYLRTKAAEQGFVTYDDILAVFPQVEENIEELDALAEAGIEAGAPEEQAGGGVKEPGQAHAAANREVCADDADGSGRPPFRQGQHLFDAIAMDDLIALYFRDIRQVPLLTAEEEITLARRMEAGQIAQEELNRDSRNPQEQVELRKVVQDGLAAREHLIRANSRLVISVAKKYVDRGVPFLDLIQEGNIGLMHTTDKFDYRLGHKFSTYATWWIRQAVVRAVANQGRTIRLPVYKNDQVNKLLWTVYQLTQEMGREPTSKELAAAMEISARKAEELLRVARRPLSLEMPVNDAEESQLDDFIADEDSPTLDETVISSTLRELFQEILRDFPPRTVRILQLRYGLVDGETYTLEEVGNKLGVCRERVRQIEAQALSRLRHPAHSRRLRDFLNK
jgi:RNA polymerase primary sigma factor